MPTVDGRPVLAGIGQVDVLRLLAAIERPTAGQLWHLGVAVDRPRRDGFAMPIFQDPFTSMDRRWPVWRIITVPLTAPHHDRRPSGSERRRLAAARMAEVGPDTVDPDARPGELSGGQCQRVAILGALVAGQRLLVSDEPSVVARRAGSGPASSSCSRPRPHEAWRCWW